MSVGSWLSQDIALAFQARRPGFESRRARQGCITLGDDALKEGNTMKRGSRAGKKRGNQRWKWRKKKMSRRKRAAKMRKK